MADETVIKPNAEKAPMHKDRRKIAFINLLPDFSWRYLEGSIRLVRIQRRGFPIFEKTPVS